jgi:hypothetical protein
MRKIAFYKQAPIISAFLALAFILGPALSFAFSGDGSGTSGEPYIITNISQLQEMQDDLDAFYNLGKDIDATGFSFNPVGPFSGTFNGRGYKITGLTINKPSATNVGLFSTIKEATTVKNVGLIDVQVTGSSNVGALVGYTDVDYTKPNAIITNCYVIGEITGISAVGGLVGFNQFTDIMRCHADIIINSTGSNVGGLVGRLNGGLLAADNALISECYSKGTVNGIHDVGGLVGNMDDTSVEKSYSTANVTGQGGWGSGVGGLVGEMYKGGSVTDCYARGSVDGYQSIGGLVGWSGGGPATYDAPVIENSYATGHITATYDPGGIVGSVDPDEEYVAMIRNCFWDRQATGTNQSYGGTSKTTNEMKNIATYTDVDTDGLFDLPNYEVWDFQGYPNDDEGSQDIWDIDDEGVYNDGYPYNIPVFDISGYARRGDGTGINDATVTVTDGLGVVAATLTTETHNTVNGWYIAKNLERGTYTLEVIFEDCPFNPVTLTLNDTDRDDVHFYTYVISGEVTRYSAGGTGASVSGITIKATEEGEAAPYATDTTGADGSYEIKVPGGTFEVEATNP